MSFPRAASALTLAACAVLVAARTATPHETVNTTVLFDREIVKILNSHCVMCHVEGGPSFPLATYEQVWVAKRKISAAVLSRHMPPWAAFSGYGRFVNENAVTLRESQFLVSWMEGLGPRNGGAVFTNTADPAAPKPLAVRARADFGAWHIGRPDVVRELPPQTIAPNAESNGFVTVTIDLGFDAGRRIRAFEYMPGDRRVVHDAVFTIKETGQWLGSWTPWYGFVTLPRGAAYRVPSGAHLVAVIHYRQADVPVVDRGKVGFAFGPAASQDVTDLVIDAMGAKRLHGEATLSTDTTLLALRPDIGTATTSVEVSAHGLDGSTNVLLFAKNLSTDWLTPYIFAVPVTLPRGTRITITAYGGGPTLKTTISTVASRPPSPVKGEKR